MLSMAEARTAAISLVSMCHLLEVMSVIGQVLAPVWRRFG
jgi:uncharacterized membrane protein AbrB (regulator of aidB expression)